MSVMDKLRDLATDPDPWASWDRGVIYAGTVVNAKVVPNTDFITGEEKGEQILVKIAVAQPVAFQRKDKQGVVHAVSLNAGDKLNLAFPQGPRADALLSAIVASGASDIVEGGWIEMGCIDERPSGKGNPMKILGGRYQPPAQGMSVGQVANVAQPVAVPQQMPVPQMAPQPVAPAPAAAPAMDAAQAAQFAAWQAQQALAAQQPQPAPSLAAMMQAQAS